MGPKNAMEIFKHLEKSNCRECGEKTCLAFAGAVFTGARKIDECPRVSSEAKALFAGGPGQVGDNGGEYFERLKGEMKTCDFAERAEVLGGTHKNGLLTLKVFGKDFSVDKEGKIYSDLHVNTYIGVPFLNHVLHGKGVEPSGKWTAYRNIPGAREQANHFNHTTERGLKMLADARRDLFDDLVHLFDAKSVAPEFQSDISVLLRFFPKLPMMICYWDDQDELGSDLHVYFDETAHHNVDAESIFYLGSGFTIMLEKLARRHGV